MDKFEYKVTARFIIRREADITAKQLSAAALEKLFMIHNIDQEGKTFSDNIIQLIAESTPEMAPLILQEIVRYYQAEARLNLRSSLRHQLENVTREQHRNIWEHEALKEAAR